MNRICLTIILALAVSLSGWCEEGPLDVKGLVLGPTASSFAKPNEPEKTAAAVAPINGPAATLSLIKNKLEQPGITATLLTLSGPERNGDEVKLVWSRDSKSAYLLHPNGELRKVELSSLKQEALFKTMRADCGNIALSKEGLLLSLRELQEVWVLDELTLAVKSKIVVPEIVNVYSSPFLSHAFATQGTPIHGKETLQVLELKLKSIVKEHKWTDLAKVAPAKRAPGRPRTAFSWDPVHVTRDGKILLAGKDFISRLAINGALLTWEEQGIETREGFGQRLSNGGKYIIVQQDAPADPMISTSQRQQAVYPVSNLQQPVATFPPAMIGSVFGYDEVAQRYVGARRGQQFTIFGKDGKPLRSYVVTTKDDDVRQMFIHPDGYRYLVVTESGIIWVECPAGDK